jgi:hypothetical protein
MDNNTTWYCVAVAVLTTAPIGDGDGECCRTKIIITGYPGTVQLKLKLKKGT